MAGSQRPNMDNVPRAGQQFPPPNLPLLPHNGRHAWTWCHSDKFQYLMAKVPGLIPVCQLSCKTFPGSPWKTQRKGKRLCIQNIKLPLPLLAANLPANHLEKRKAIAPQRKRGWGCSLQHCLLAVLVFHQEHTLEGQSAPSPALAQTHFMQRKKPGQAKGTVLPSYLVTKKINQRLLQSQQIFSEYFPCARP